MDTLACFSGRLTGGGPDLYNSSVKIVIFDKDTRELYQNAQPVIRGRQVAPYVCRAFMRCKFEMDAWIGTFASFANSRQFNCYPIKGSEGYEHWAIQLDRDYRCILSIDYDRAGREEIWILRLEHRNDLGATL